MFLEMTALIELLQSLPEIRALMRCAHRYKPSRRLPKFSFDTKQQIVENVSQDTFRKSTIQSLQELMRRGWSVQSDGQWLLFECGLGSNTGLCSLQLFAELANSIKTERM
jgi:hypothetical protein